MRVLLLLIVGFGCQARPAVWEEFDRFKGTSALNAGPLCHTYTSGAGSFEILLRSGRELDSILKDANVEIVAVMFMRRFIDELSWSSLSEFDLLVGGVQVQTDALKDERLASLMSSGQRELITAMAGPALHGFERKPVETEYLIRLVTRETLEKMCSGLMVEGRVGQIEFALSENDKNIIRAFLSRL